MGGKVCSSPRFVKGIGVCTNDVCMPLPLPVMMVGCQPVKFVLFYLRVLPLNVYSGREL
jgi:hypothetical protein